MQRYVFSLILTSALASSFIACATNLDQCIKEHNEARLAFEPYIDSITCKPYKVATGHTGFYTFYEYDYGTPDIAIIGQRYWWCEHQLRNTVLAHALGDGFMFGIGAALLNKMLSDSPLDKTTFIGLAALTVATIIYRIKSHGSVAYISGNLKKGDNLFGIGSDSILMGFMAAAVGYTGAHGALCRILDR